MYVAIINMPGYLPESDPAVFPSAQEAWEYLADEAMRDEDSAWVADNPDDPDGPASLHPAILRMQEYQRRDVSTFGSVDFAGYAYSVDYAEDPEL